MMARSTYSSLFPALLAWSLFCLAASQSNGGCRAGWWTIGITCYRFISEPKSWAGARDYCIEQEMAGLLDVENRNENIFVMDEMNRNSVPDVWIGLSDTETEGIMLSVNSGFPPRARNWKGGEPNDFGYNEDCVILTLRGPISRQWTNWNDVPCDRYYHFFCKYQRIPTELPPF